MYSLLEKFSLGWVSQASSISAKKLLFFHIKANSLKIFHRQLNVNTLSFCALVKMYIKTPLQYHIQFTKSRFILLSN